MAALTAKSTPPNYIAELKFIRLSSQANRSMLFGLHRWAATKLKRHKKSGGRQD
jgi:hypothetical protein